MRCFINIGEDNALTWKVIKDKLNFTNDRDFVGYLLSVASTNIRNSQNVDLIESTYPRDNGPHQKAFDDSRPFLNEAFSGAGNSASLSRSTVIHIPDSSNDGDNFVSNSSKFVDNGDACDSYISDNHCSSNSEFEESQVANDSEANENIISNISEVDDYLVAYDSEVSDVSKISRNHVDNISRSLAKHFSESSADRNSHVTNNFNVITNLENSCSKDSDKNIYTRLNTREIPSSPFSKVKENIDKYKCTVRGVKRKPNSSFGPNENIHSESSYNSKANCVSNTKKSNENHILKTSRSTENDYNVNVEKIKNNSDGMPQAKKANSNKLFYDDTITKTKIAGNDKYVGDSLKAIEKHVSTSREVDENLIPNSAKVNEKNGSYCRQAPESHVANKSKEDNGNLKVLRKGIKRKVNTNLQNNTDLSNYSGSSSDHRVFYTPKVNNGTNSSKSIQRPLDSSSKASKKHLADFTNTKQSFDNANSVKKGTSRKRKNSQENINAEASQTANTKVRRIFYARDFSKANDSCDTSSQKGRVSGPPVPASSSKDKEVTIYRGCRYCDDPDHEHGNCPLNSPLGAIYDSVNFKAWNGHGDFSKVSLPFELEIKDEKVFALEEIPFNTRFGPVVGIPIKASKISEESSFDNIWELSPGKYISTLDRHRSNWTRWIRPAVTREQRNLIAINIKGLLYLVTLRPLNIRDELLYWAEPSQRWALRNMEMSHCGGCNLRFKSPVTYRLHCAVFHDPRESLTVRKYHCKICPQQILGRINFINHATREHRGKGALQCKFCSKFFLKRENVEKHIHFGCPESPFLSKPTCYHCGKKTCQPSKLKAHIKRMHTDLFKVLHEFQCYLCTKVFASHDGMMRHKREVHMKRSHGCSRCGKKFQNSSNLKVHMLTHSGVRPFRCKVKRCNSTFTTKQKCKFHYVNVHNYSESDIPEILRTVEYSLESYSGENKRMIKNKSKGKSKRNGNEGSAFKRPQRRPEAPLVPAVRRPLVTVVDPPECIPNTSTVRPTDCSPGPSAFKPPEQTQAAPPAQQPEYTTSGSSYNPSIQRPEYVIQGSQHPGYLSGVQHPEYTPIVQHIEYVNSEPPVEHIKYTTLVPRHQQPEYTTIIVRQPVAQQPIAPQIEYRSAAPVVQQAQSSSAVPVGLQSEYSSVATVVQQPTVQQPAIQRLQYASTEPTVQQTESTSAVPVSLQSEYSSVAPVVQQRTVQQPAVQQLRFASTEPTAQLTESTSAVPVSLQSEYSSVAPVVQQRTVQQPAVQQLRFASTEPTAQQTESTSAVPVSLQSEYTSVPAGVQQTVVQLPSIQQLQYVSATPTAQQTVSTSAVPVSLQSNYSSLSAGVQQQQPSAQQLQYISATPIVQQPASTSVGQAILRSNYSSVAPVLQQTATQQSEYTSAASRKIHQSSTSAAQVIVQAEYSSGVSNNQGPVSHQPVVQATTIQPESTSAGQVILQSDYPSATPINQGDATQQTAVQHKENISAAQDVRQFESTSAAPVTLQSEFLSPAPVNQLSAQQPKYTSSASGVRGSPMAGSSREFEAELLTSDDEVVFIDDGRPFNCRPDNTEILVEAAIEAVNRDIDLGEAISQAISNPEAGGSHGESMNPSYGTATSNALQEFSSPKSAFERVQSNQK